MTPDANDLCVFAVRRGNIQARFDVRNTYYIHSSAEEGLIKVSLGELTVEEPCYGTSASAIKRTGEDQPKYIRITDFDDYGIPEGHEYMTAEEYSIKHLLQPGDILFARTGGTVGKTYYYDGSIGNAVFAGYCIRFRFDESKVLPKFVYWYTKTDEYVSWVKGIQRPSGQPNINKEEYKSFRITLPDLPTQKKLVEQIEKIQQEQNQKLHEANALLRENPTYLLQRLGLKFSFANSEFIYGTKLNRIDGRLDADYYSPKFAHFRKQIGELPYSTVSIHDIADRIVTGFAAGKQDQADNLPEEKRVPHLRPFSVTTEGELSFDTKKYVPNENLKPDDYCKKGEIIFNNTNSPDLVGKTTVFDSDVLCATSNHMTRITVKEEVNPYYVASFFNLLLSIGYWKLLCTNFNNQAGVNTETLKKVRIPLPEKAIQDQIAAELMQRRSQANTLRKEAQAEWKAAKQQFERGLLGE